MSDDIDVRAELERLRAKFTAAAEEAMSAANGYSTTNQWTRVGFGQWTRVGCEGQATGYRNAALDMAALLNRLPAPPVIEPQELGSEVEAAHHSVTGRARWIRTYEGPARYAWLALDGRGYWWTYWDELIDPKVLRVGFGEEGE